MQPAYFVGVLVYFVTFWGLYLVVRAGVRAGIEDAWKRRAKRERSPESRP